MYAVIKTGGKQYKVASGDVIKVENSLVMKVVKIVLARFWLWVTMSANRWLPVRRLKQPF